MGVLDRARAFAGGDDECGPFVCVACETTFEVQHHSCPKCGGYDVRRTKWVRE